VTTASHYSVIIQQSKTLPHNHSSCLLYSNVTFYTYQLFQFLHVICHLHLNFNTPYIFPSKHSHPVLNHDHTISVFLCCFLFHLCTRLTTTSCFCLTILFSGDHSGFDRVPKCFAKHLRGLPRNFLDWMLSSNQQCEITSGITSHQNKI